MPRMVKMEKDGIVTEVVASSFRNVYAARGYQLVDEATPADPKVLGLGPDENLEDYKARRDEARQQASAQQQAYDRQLAEQVRAEQAAQDKAQADEQRALAAAQRSGAQASDA